MPRAIGIDLGTTYTLVATTENARPKIIPNAEGEHLTPSVVCFRGQGGPVVGQPARRLAVANPDSTVFSIKRRMGSGYRVVAAGQEYTPQEVSSLILRKVKSDAETYLGEEFDAAVITVPAYFDDRQRQATREAGLLAGLDVMKIINEPTAAALAYGLDREDAHTVLVWDLGGGTFDVSILELGEGIFEVRTVSGDSWLGGDDFDNRIMEYLAGDYRKTYGVDLLADSTATQRLREVAEKAKVQLSSAHETLVRLPALDTQQHGRLEAKLTRKQLEGLTADLLQRMAAPTRQALADAGLTADDIDRVLLVGGATRMPAVRALAREMIGKEPYRYIDPDETVAMGAAIQAGMLLGVVDKVVLLDVLPLSLGVETQGGLVARIIPRNTPLPASEGHVFTTAEDYQTSVDIHVLQGERELAADNISLGRFQLNGIPSASRGVPKVEVAFEADVDGIVHVSARDLLYDHTEVNVKVTSTKFLAGDEISSLAEEALQSAQRDREKRRRIEARIEARNLVDAAEMVLEEPGASQASSQNLQITQAVSNLQEALDVPGTKSLETRIAEMRQLLATIHKDRQGLSETIATR